MKREIKFRAWDTEDHRMLSDFADGMMIQMNTGQLGWYDDEDNFVACNYPLMQYTGLKDSKSVEIYEGDICDIYESKDSLATDAEQLKYSNCVVVFDTGCFCFTIPVFPDSKANIPMCVENSREWIYKGNIYENPELL